MQKIGERGTTGARTHYQAFGRRGKSIFAADKGQDKGEPVFEIWKTVGKVRKQKEKRPQTEYRKNIRGIDKKRSVVIPKIAGMESTAKTSR